MLALAGPLGQRGPGPGAGHHPGQCHHQDCLQRVTAPWAERGSGTVARAATRVTVSASDVIVQLAARVSCDTSAAGERLRREQTTKGRELRQTLELLMKMQKAENNGQAAGNDGNEKDGESPTTATSAPARTPNVATSSEAQSEAGAASKPASRKRLQDKNRSMTALEMMMSGRLDEQGFEKFFADPPAALVVIKGLQRLAELEVLPDRATVEAWGGHESTASKLGMKKAQIEANGDETQLERGSEDNIHVTDSSDENRSQLRDQDSWPRMEHGSNTDHAGNQEEGLVGHPEPTRGVDAVLELCHA